MDNIRTVLEELEKDRVNNISIINFIKNNRILSVDSIGKSFLVRGVSDQRWVYLSCNDKDGLLKLKNKLNNEDEFFASIDDWMVPVLTGGKKIIWDLQTVQFYLPDNISIPEPEYKTLPLTKEDAVIVYENSEYKEYISLDYVREQIAKGVSAGLYENNKLVCWSITQDDGAIGFLHTLDDYRRKGYGYSITLSMIEKLRSRGELPFAYVKEANEKSINLLLKLGFKKLKKVHWFQVQ